MFERLVENWLTKTNERAFQLPFCHLLQAEGYSVVHLTRHGEMEQGKDVIAVAPDGVPCAYQLKGAGTNGRINLRDWEQFKYQIERLVELQIIHPSIPGGIWHRPYLVTNGDLDEPVRQEIADRNRQWLNSGRPELGVITKGNLLLRFKNLRNNFWPKEPEDIKLLLELFLDTGKGCLNKPSLWNLLVAELPFNSQTLTVRQFTRSIANAGILCSHALSPYVQTGNYVAIIEGWTLYIASCLSLAEKYEISERQWRPIVNLAYAEIEDNLLKLWEEVSQRTHLFEGDPMPEIVYRSFYFARITWLLGMISVWGLWCRANKVKLPIELKDFLLKHIKHIKFFTEADTPKFLAIIWLLRKITGTPDADAILGSLISSICDANKQERSGLPDSYHEVHEVLEHLLPGHEAWDESFIGQSYTLESLVLLFSKRLWRQKLNSLWPSISRIAWCSYEPKESWLYYWWNTKELGSHKVEIPQYTQSWVTLRGVANCIETEKLPRLLQTIPEIFLLFLIVVPHRLTPNAAKFLDNWVDSLPHVNDH